MHIHVNGFKYSDWEMRILSIGLSKLLKNYLNADSSPCRRSTERQKSRAGVFEEVFDFHNTHFFESSAAAVDFESRQRQELASMIVWLLVLTITGCYGYSYSVEYNRHKIPQEVMVEVINNLALKLLAIHNEGNENNIAISPYGAVSVLVALLEGVRGDAVREIQHSANIPSDISVIRIGLRDIHRHLKSYFIPEEGFLSGLTLSHDNVTLHREYEDILKFYGYDVNSFNNALYPDYVYTTGRPESTEITSTSVTSTEVMTTETDRISESTTGSAQESTTMPTSTSTVSTSTMFTTTSMTSTAGTTASQTGTSTMMTTTDTGAMMTTGPSTVTSTAGTSTTASQTGTSTMMTTTDTSAMMTTEPSTVMTTSAMTTTGASTMTTTGPIQSTKATVTSTVVTTTGQLSTTAETESTMAQALVSTTTEPSTSTKPTTITESTTEMNQESTTTVSVQSTTLDTTMLSTLVTTTDSTSTVETTTTSEEMASSTTTTSEEMASSTTTTSEEMVSSTTTEMMSTTNESTTSADNGESNKKHRSPRSLVDYVIARYYDDHVITQRPPPYNSEKDLYFLVNGKYKEANINYMTYDTVLPFHYIPHLNTLALRFPLDSSKYYLLLLLPVNETEDIDKLICDLRLNTSLKYIINNLRYTHVKAVIPSFMLKGYIILTSTFQKMGIKKVFEPRHADFSPMTSDPNIYVTNIEQAITVTIRNYVDPVTMNSNRYLQRNEPVLFKADHPFLYFVIDSEIDVTLMAGKIINPLNSRIR